MDKKYKISDHTEEIITHIIKNLIWFPICSIIPLVFSFIYNKYKQLDTDNVIIILLLISIFISVFSIIVIINTKHNIKNVDVKKENENNNHQIHPLTNFRIKYVETELNFVDRENIISTLSYDMIATEDDIDYFEKEMIWTGNEYYGTKLIEAFGNYRLELFDTNNSIHKYRVLFNTSIKREEPVKFKLETTVSDNSHKMMPISSYMVKHQIDKLTIRVVVPSGSNYITNVKKSIYADMNRQLQIGKSEKAIKKVIGGKECYEYTIENPTLLYRYFLEWEFTN